MSVFIGQLIGFGVIVFVLMRYAAPPIRKLMIAQQEAVRTQLEESAKAAQRLADADRFHAERLELGRVEAQQIIDEASADSVRVAELLRLQAEAESDRLKGYGDQQVIQLRAQRIAEENHLPCLYLVDSGVKTTKVGMSKLVHVLSLFLYFNFA